MNKNRIILVVTNDLVTDQRLHRIASTLVGMGADVYLMGRKLRSSPEIPKRNYKTIRIKMIFNRGPLFYLFYNFRVLSSLLFKKFNVIVSNDLDTLPGCYLTSIIKKSELVFDSHEYFTEVPELQGRIFKQKIWQKLEGLLVPKIKYAYTVCDSLAEIFQKKYGINFATIRNLPYRKNDLKATIKLHIPENKFIILYQGAVNVGRGLEKIILSMKFLDNVLFIIIGRGDIEAKLKQLVAKENLQGKVVFTGVIPYDELYSYTARGNLGISLEENLGLNYYYALPNKIFDYIQAKIPVLSSPFPEMKKIVESYNIGTTTDENDPGKIARVIKKIISDKAQIHEWGKNLEKAADELTWEKEEKKLQDFYRIVLK